LRFSTRVGVVAIFALLLGVVLFIYVGMHFSVPLPF